MGVILFQFPLHRDPRCNLRLSSRRRWNSWFQFPLHRDPRCNLAGKYAGGRYCSFSSLYIGILAATQDMSLPGDWRTLKFQFPLHRDPRCNIALPVSCTILYPSFSSLYIGILAATYGWRGDWENVLRVSVPFTSGSSLQLASN